MAVWVLWCASLVALALGVVGGAEVALRLRREWVAAHLSLPPQDDERFVSNRLLGYVNRPGYTYASQGQAGTILHYTNNALGLRGPQISQSKPAGVRRIVVVGGSTVYGALVDDTDTITVQLEALLRERLGTTVEVINGGVPGYVALQELLFSTSVLLELEPDVLIDLDGLNDVFYGSLEEWPPQIAADELGIIGDRRFPQVVTMVDATMFPNGLLEHQLMMLSRDVRRSRSIVTTRHPPFEPRQVNERVIALHAQSLGLLARYGRQAGIRVIAALQPLVATGRKQLALEEQQAVQRQDYWSEGGWQEIASAMYPRLVATTRAAVEAEGGSFADMTDVFDHEPLATYAEDAVHYSPLGDLRLAQALAPLIEERLQHHE